MIALVSKSQQKSQASANGSRHAASMRYKVAARNELRGNRVERVLSVASRIQWLISRSN